jgi:hypothetical protein
MEFSVGFMSSILRVRDNTMTTEHRRILLDATRSIQMMLARDEIGMPQMSPEVVEIHKRHLTNLKSLLQYDLNQPDFKLEIDE